MYASAVSSLSGLSESSRSLLIRSAEAEELAAEILHRKSMLVDLDRQRQECMQALATFREKKPTATASSSSSSSTASVPSLLHAPPPSKLWVTFNTGFMKLPRAQVITMLQADRQKLDREIDKTRDEMKELMAKLQQIQQSLDIPKGLIDFALK